MRFNMKGVKPVTIHYAFHSKLSSSLCLIYKEEKVISCILYTSTVRGLMNVMKWPNISHVVGVVSGHMESPSEAVKRVLKYFRCTSVTYSGCSDWVCGLDFVGDMDKRIYVSQVMSQSIILKDRLSMEVESSQRKSILKKIVQTCSWS